MLDAAGKDDAAALGETADAPATVIRAALAARDGSLLATSSARAGSIPERRQRSGSSGSGRRPDPRRAFRVDRAVTIVVAAPGGRILDGAPPPSELLVEIRRAAPRRYEQDELPPPLAEPRLDVRVDAATALAYEVRAGEFIQVIDVEGKQCSDFLAFDGASSSAGSSAASTPRRRGA